MILGIDTVTKIGGLAVVEDGTILRETTIDTHLRHNAKIIPSLDNLLKSIGISNIDAVAVDIGPGSFTGIRVGLACAKGLVQPDGKRLIGVCSLEALACRAIEKGISEGIKFLVPVIDAKRGMFYSAIYEPNGKSIKEPYLTTMDIILKEKSPDSLLFGPEINGVYPTAGIVAILGERKIKEGLVQKSVEPMYLHEIEYHV